MNELKNGAADYDAVWPASGIWLSLGDDQHLIKHDKSISSSPVVFGIRKSVAEDLSFTSGKVSVKDILSAITIGKLSFCMTSAPSQIRAQAHILASCTLLRENPRRLPRKTLTPPELR